MCNGTDNGVLFADMFYFLSRQAATVSVWMNSEEAEQKGNVIVLDPGHGGSDPGMIGIDGLEEKESTCQ